MKPASGQIPPATAVFEQHRSRLWGIAYRMLGARAEADDLVQEAWLRWDRAPQPEIRSPEAWLVTATTRLAIDRLRQLKSERETYTGSWLPEPMIADAAPPADQATELASDLSVAFLAMLERMTPEERAALLLHDVFDSDYGDIAQILGKSATTCRQIVSRARKHLREGKPRIHVSAAAHAKLLQRMVAAIQAQDQTALVQLVADDAVWTSDGGGKARAAKKRVRGAVRIARFGTGVFRRYLAELEFRRVTINDEPGIVVLFQGSPLSAITIRTDGQKILDVYSILNPDKLRGFETLSH
jgi:RNA polymerase sigma-70 factor (ECF subfamily)